MPGKIFPIRMIYTPKTVLAMNIAYDAHNGTYDKNGVPYILHPVHLAEQMKDEDSTIVALLHDTVEDTSVTIREKGFSERVLEAVDLLIHREEEGYFDYVRRTKENPLAATVKLADLRHNSDVTRYCRELTDHEKKKVEKYQEAIRILTE